MAAPTSQRSCCLSPHPGFMLSTEETKRFSFQTQGACTCCPAAPSDVPVLPVHLLRKAMASAPAAPATPCDVTLCSFFFPRMPVFIFILDPPSTNTHQHMHSKFHEGQQFAHPLGLQLCREHGKCPETRELTDVGKCGYTAFLLYYTLLCPPPPAPLCSASTTLPGKK